MQSSLRESVGGAPSLALAIGEFLDVFTQLRYDIVQYASEGVDVDRHGLDGFRSIERLIGEMNDLLDVLFFWSLAVVISWIPAAASPIMSKISANAAIN